MNSEHHRLDTKTAKIDPEVRELRQNNMAALGIHFLLSLAGVALFAATWIAVMTVAPSFNSLVEGPVTFVNMLPWLISIPAMSLAYIYCGYIYLTPFKKKTWRSVSLLALVLLVHSILYLVANSFADFTGSASDEGLIETVATLSYISSPLINSMWLAIVMLFFSIFDSVTSVPLELVAIPSSIIGALLPPGLLYLGMCLKQRYPNLTNASKTRAATVEEGDHS